jgi:hypothetical protein
MLYHFIGESKPIDVVRSLRLSLATIAEHGFAYNVSFYNVFFSSAGFYTHQNCAKGAAYLWQFMSVYVGNLKHSSEVQEGGGGVYKRRCTIQLGFLYQSAIPWPPPHPVLIALTCEMYLQGDETV